MRTPSDHQHVIALIRSACARISREQRVPVSLPDPVDLDFELSRAGIDSILIAEVVEDIEVNLGRILPYRELLLARTLGEFVAVVCESEA